MYQFEYAQVLEGRADDAKDRERKALDHSIGLMKEARELGTPSAKSIEAVYFTQKLWTILVEDLANADNDLPDSLRAQIISIGIWILRECEKLRANEISSFDDLIMVSESIRDGLK